MAMSNVGRPPSGRRRDVDLVAIPVPQWRKQALEAEERALGCRSVAELLRKKLEWPDVPRHLGPKKEVCTA